jgi:hypothetical protein
MCAMFHAVHETEVPEHDQMHHRLPLQYTRILLSLIDQAQSSLVKILTIIYPSVILICLSMMMTSMSMHGTFRAL